MRLNDAVLGVLLLVGGSRSPMRRAAFPPSAGQQYGADVFPTIVAAGFAICGVVLVASGFASAARCSNGPTGRASATACATS
jgi:putative tricarboxylic transport membrane protein